MIGEITTEDTDMTETFSNAIGDVEEADTTIRWVAHIHNVEVL